jgi:hypothetical protein
MEIIIFGLIIQFCWVGFGQKKEFRGFTEWTKEFGQLSPIGGRSVADAHK